MLDTTSRDLAEKTAAVMPGIAAAAVGISPRLAETATRLDRDARAALAADDALYAAYEAAAARAAEVSA